MEAKKSKKAKLNPFVLTALILAIGVSIFLLRAPLKTYFCHQLALFPSIFVRDKSLVSQRIARIVSFSIEKKIAALLTKIRFLEIPLSFFSDDLFGETIPPLDLDFSQEEIQDYQVFGLAESQSPQKSESNLCYAFMTLNSGEQFPLICHYNQEDNTISMIPQSIGRFEQEGKPSWVITYNWTGDGFSAVMGGEFSLKNGQLHIEGKPVSPSKRKPKFLVQSSSDSNS